MSDPEKNTLLYTCSGAANTGFLADSIARKMMKEGCGNMSCLAGPGANLPKFHESLKNMSQKIIIDGCSPACGKKIFENYGLKEYSHFVLTDFGVEKGKTEITESVISGTAARIKEKM